LIDVSPGHITGSHSVATSHDRYSQEECDV
jgi:hypothetical protein